MPHSASAELHSQYHFVTLCNITSLCGESFMAALCYTRPEAQPHTRTGYKQGEPPSSLTLIHLYTKHPRPRPITIYSPDCVLSKCPGSKIRLQSSSTGSSFTESIEGANDCAKRTMWNCITYANLDFN